MSGGCHSLPADGPQTNQSIVATLGNVSQYNDTGLASGVRYFYTVRAVTALGRGFFANLTNATTSSPAGTPLNFQASPGPDHNEITLTWTMPEGGSNAAPITGFNLYRQTNPYFPPPENNFCPSPTATGCMPGGSNPAPNEPIYAHLNASAGTFVDKGVGAQMYWYILASVSSAGQSFPAWTQGQTYVQPPMPFLTAQAGPNAGEITVHWLPNIGNPKAVTAFHLDRNNGSGWEPVGNFTWNGSPNGTSYVDEGFANGEAVSYRMYAANPAGVSGYSSTPEVVAGNMPDAVAGLSVGPGSVPGSIDISWTRVRDSTFAPTLAYRLYRSAGSGAASVLASTLNGTFEDSGLDGNTTYLYTVTTVNRFGEGPAAPLISGKPASVPQAPQVAAAAGPASGNLTIKWTLDPHPIAALFRIYVQNGTNLTFVGTAKGTDRAFVVGGLGRGTTRTFVVTGVNSAGEGAESSPASAKTFDVPAAPSQLTANGALNAGEIDLAWRAPQEDGGAAITAYRIYRAANASAPMHLLATVAASPQLYRDVGLANDTSFLYEISAVNPVGESAR
jgi:titin